MLFQTAFQLLIQRIFGAQGCYTLTGLCPCSLILRTVQYQSNDIAYLCHILLLEATGGQSRGTQTDAAGHKRAELLKRNGILVGSYAYLIQKVLRQLAGNPLAAQIHQHQMIIRTAGNDAEAVLGQSIRQCLGIFDDLSGIFLEFR